MSPALSWPRCPVCVGWVERTWGQASSPHLQNGLCARFLHGFGVTMFSSPPPLARTQSVASPVVLWLSLLAAHVWPVCGFWQHIPLAVSFHSLQDAAKIITSQDPCEATVEGPPLGTRPVCCKCDFLWFNSYHRKLRAMKAGKEARKTPIETTTSTAAIPGTNVYNTDR